MLIYKNKKRHFQKNQYGKYGDDNIRINEVLKMKIFFQLIDNCQIIDSLLQK